MNTKEKYDSGLLGDFETKVFDKVGRPLPSRRMDLLLPGIRGLAGMGKSVDEAADVVRNHTESLS
jgi:hypothetical protein